MRTEIARILKRHQYSTKGIRLHKEDISDPLLDLRGKPLVKERDKTKGSMLQHIPNRWIVNNPIFALEVPNVGSVLRLFDRAMNRIKKLRVPTRRDTRQ